MSTKDIKSLYITLLESGDLLEMFPEMTGEWLKDKKKFTSQYDFNEDMLGDNNFHTSFDVYEDF